MVVYLCRYVLIGIEFGFGGGFGDVWKGCWTKDVGDCVVAMKIPRARFPIDEDDFDPGSGHLNELQKVLHFEHRQLP